MATGSRCGTSEPVLGVALFVDDEGGYTSVAVACTLLVSLSLVFALAGAEWVSARSADVQTTADACALAGANVVGGYVTVATALDACVLSLGLTGVLVLAVGLVCSAIPGLSAVGAKVISAGVRVLDARRSFATSCAKGLGKLEATLPALIVANSGRVVAANSEGSASLVGVAVPFPQTSQTDWSGMDTEIDTDGMLDSAQKLQESSDKAKQANDEVDAATRAGWLADCGDEPFNMQQRASTLANLAPQLNPDYPSVDGWNFGVPLARARAYYAARLAVEAPEADGIEALTDSCARKRFYTYALTKVNEGHYTQDADGRVDLDLPELPHNSDEVRQTTLYSEVVWPCTTEADGVVLHSTLECPGATGESAGVMSLEQQAAGGAGLCPVCRMDVGDMGKVAAASTNIDNGFEHHWRRVVLASRDFKQANDKLVDAKQAMDEAAKQADDAFDRALDALSVPRPKLQPAGCWGCVGVVVRGEGATVPTELTQSFTSSQDLPAGAAVSAATLAPDEQTAQNNVVSRLFDGISQGEQGEGVAGALGGVVGVWGSVLTGYTSAYEGLGSTADGVLDGIEGVFGSSTASWLRKKLSESVAALGLEPCDLRLRKPVLCNTNDVLARDGGDTARIRTLIQSVPAGASPGDIARAVGLSLADEVGGTTLTLAEVTIPGTGLTVPIRIDLSQLGDVA